MNKNLIVIVGPTAVGKTALCVELAKQLSAEVLSADSRQFYTGMSIGTAQPSLAEMEGVPHYFLDFLAVDQLYSAGKFREEALKKLTSLFTTHPYALLTGGSGLYIKAVCEGLPIMPSIDTSIRNWFNDALVCEGLDYLLTLLAKVDPAYYQEVDLQNPQRVIRALEVYEGTGIPYSHFRKQQVKLPYPPFNIIKIGLMRDKEELHHRIATRVDQMVIDGLFKEVESLYPYRDCNALRTLGYQEVFAYLAGHYKVEEAIEQIKINTRKYAKRQLTWFSKDQSIHWFHPDDYKGIMGYMRGEGVL